MLIHEMDPQECREFVRQHDIARIACAHNDQPYIVPISYSFDGGRDCLYAFSGVGRKITWMRENPKVCVEVDAIEHTGLWTTVLIFGRYEELLDRDADREARDRALAHFRARKEWWLPGAGRVPGREHDHVVVFRIAIVNVSGRRAARPTV
jgi:nitroimidazol reductase NimA-like FMN-containing flavoprotein (pyridoxamine 5'-phosphate oxidase superfamily)